MIKPSIFILAIFAIPLNLFADPAVEIAMQLKLGDKDSSIRPPFSPKGTKLSLVSEEVKGLQGHDHLVTKISLRKDGQIIALARSKKAGAYDLLYIDKNLDGSLTDETPITGEIKERRGNWWSSFKASFQSSHASIDALPAEGDYSASLWAVVEKQDARPDVIRYSGGDFYTGSVEIAETKYHLYVKDINNDALITDADYWGITAEGVKAKTPVRSIKDFAWANGKAWKIKLGNTQGTNLTLRQHHTDKTEQQDKNARNPYFEDEKLARAEKPLYFAKDYQKALEQARKEKKPLFIKFETTWCGPCYKMTNLVFNAQTVVDAAKDVICLKIDGDEHKDLVEKYKITGYPHLLILDSNGKIIKRASGYQTAKKTIELIQSAKK